MHFIKLPNPQAAAGILAERLVAELSRKQRVLWLVSGGSNIPIEVEVIHKLPAELRPYLTLMYDERYGPFDHPDSNARQLRAAGFSPDGATFVPALTRDNL